MKRVRIIVTGNVQGVGYREYVQEKATMLDVTGYVHNLDDGTVEAVFEGYEDDVDEMVENCRTGTRKSKVEDIELEEGEYSGEFEEFEIRY